VRRDGAPKRASRSDGAPRREPRRAGAPKRESRGATPSRELRRDGPQKSRGSASKGTGKSGRAGKRTSRSSDERSPTRSGVDYPSPKFRRKNEDLEAAPQVRRSSLRKVRQPPEAASRPSRERKARRTTPTRRGRVRTTGAGDELARLAGRGARRAETELARAADAFAAGRERDAARLLRPLRDAYPDASAVRELLGLCQYRLGQYQAATKELEAFVELTNSVEQHPVLMDCARALGRHRRVEELWEELAAASPSGALVTEGRIVLAGARADQGRLTEAIATLDRRSPQQHRVQDHHVRVWYALGDLYERAGDLPKARELFQRIRRHDAGFADVAERLAALG
jgi:tetratricopeptide (TPR) repeat protein